MKSKKIMRGGLKISLLIFTMFYCSVSFGYREYFIPSKSGVQLGNFEGTQHLVFEYPGKNAKELYQRALEIFRGVTAKEERLENISIDFYGEQTKKSGHKYYYRYSVKFKDGQVRVDNPYILISATIPGVAGFPDMNALISSIEDTRDKDKEKNRDYYENSIKVLKDDLSELITYFNYITDDLVEFLKPESLEDPSKWTPVGNTISFTLTPEGLKNSNESDYFVFELPGKSKCDIEAKISLLINLLNSSGQAESQLNNINLPVEVQELFKLTSPWSPDCPPEISTKIKAGPYQTISIRSNGAIRAPKTNSGNIGYDLNIIYADGKIKIGNPKITYLSQEYTGGYEGIVGYKFASVKTGIFNEKDMSVLYPEHKLAIEEHFGSLFSLIRRYLNSDSFEKICSW